MSMVVDGLLTVVVDGLLTVVVDGGEHDTILIKNRRPGMEWILTDRLKMD